MAVSCVYRAGSQGTFPTQQAFALPVALLSTLQTDPSFLGETVALIQASWILPPTLGFRKGG